VSRSLCRPSRARRVPVSLRTADPEIVEHGVRRKGAQASGRSRGSSRTHAITGAGRGCPSGPVRRAAAATSNLVERCSASSGEYCPLFGEHCSREQSIRTEESVCAGVFAQGKDLPRTAVYPNLLWCSKFKAPIPGSLGGQGGRRTAQISSYPPVVHRHPTADRVFRPARRLRLPGLGCSPAFPVPISFLGGAVAAPWQPLATPASKRSPGL
jgi:hypothetical protein